MIDTAESADVCGAMLERVSESCVRSGATAGGNAADESTVRSEEVEDPDIRPSEKTYRANAISHVYSSILLLMVSARFLFLRELREQFREGQHTVLR